MTADQFLAKWHDSDLSERSAYQQHFLDLCDLLGQPKPAEVDKDGSWYTFERGLKKDTGGQGFADVWMKGRFGWEYKGKRKDLKAAYQQLCQYREALDNPPLLVVCDLNRFEVHTNFPNTAKKVHAFDLAGLADDKNRQTLRWAFTDPDRLHPGRTQEQVTQDIAERFKRLADGLHARHVDPVTAGHFLMKLMFCMFAEDIELLPERLFLGTVTACKDNPDKLTAALTRLFAEMNTGGMFGTHDVLRFNGRLFADGSAVPLTRSEVAELHDCARCDWSQVEPSVFGTLFERLLDPGKRSQLGAHYTGRADIDTLLRPVLVAPLRREWDAVRAEADGYYARADKAKSAKAKADNRQKAENAVGVFLKRLAETTVLDPACGSGNFLYAALHHLLDLEKEVLTYLSEKDQRQRFPGVRPTQLRGIEKNPFARELAQVVIWIGFLQWMKENGYVAPSDPVLDPMDSIECRDAILELRDTHTRTHTHTHTASSEPEWPAAEFIVGNPPFLGGKMLRGGLGDDYVNALFKVWKGRVAAEADLVVYWFEKARAMIAAGKVKRAGLLATQGIRGGANRETLAKIKETGDIYFAVSDRDWQLDGAAVNISMIGFDDGTETARELDGQPVPTINANLTASAADLTQAEPLNANCGIGFMGDTKGGPFDIPLDVALKLLNTPNVNGRPSSDVITPWCNGKDVTQRGRDVWIIDFPLGTDEATASLYDSPFNYLKAHVEAARDASRSKIKSWWLHERPRVDMRRVLTPLPRFLVTPNVTKYRLFTWMEAPMLADHQLIAFGYADDYHFGLLHSRFHEVWALRQGTRLEDRPRYTPTTCFETFPFPEPSAAQREAVAEAARQLHRLRDNWHNPPQWVRTETLTFPGSVDGPWRRYVTDANAAGVGTVRYPRTVPADAVCAASLKKRTLTNLYNERPGWLANAHRDLDAAVAAAYGWPADLPDDQVLARLLALNLQRAGG